MQLLKAFGYASFSLMSAGVVNTVAIEPRTVGGVFICTDVNWQGTCGYKVQPLNTCIDLGSDWDKKISSFGPDSGTVCTVYPTHHCVPCPSSCSWQSQIRNPGYADLRNLQMGSETGSNFNDQISSFSCVAG